MIELLVVLAVGAIIATLSVTVYTKILAAGGFNSTAQAVAGALDQARQTALTRNSYVEVRIYELPDYPSPPNGTLAVYRGMQTFLVTGTGYVQLTKLYLFPIPLIIQSSDLTHSTLLDGSQDSSLTLKTYTALAFPSTPSPIPAPLLPNFQNNYAAITFRFAPNGSLNLSAAKQWFLTIISERDGIVANNLPANYITVQIDSFSGKTTYFRP